MENKKGLIIICVGSPQTGKTTFVKKCLSESKISPKSIAAIDYHQEYGKIGANFLEPEDLINFALKTENKTLIFEEASSYLNNGQNLRLLKSLLSRSMGHLGHNIFLNFHYLKSVPSDILPFCTHIYYTKSIEKGNVSAPLDRLTEPYKLISREKLFLM